MPNRQREPGLRGRRNECDALDLLLESVRSGLERRETRGSHNRADYPELDPSLQVNLVWSGPGHIMREAIPPIPDEIAALMHDVSSDGKLVE